MRGVANDRGRVNKIMNSKTEHRHNEATLSVRPAMGSWSLIERKVTTVDVIGFGPLPFSTCAVWTLALALCPEFCFSYLYRRDCKHWS